MSKRICQKWDSNPRPQRGPEAPNSVLNREGMNLESGALDRSAILTIDYDSLNNTDKVHITVYILNLLHVRHIRINIHDLLNNQVI